MKAESPLIRTIELKDRNGRVVGTKEVVTYQGLLAKAHDEGLKKVATTLVQTPSDDNARVAIVRAEVETGKGIFQGYGDASPDNVNPFIVPHLIRMAETRAKARALRDAVNVGVVSFEELDGEPLVEEVEGRGLGANGNGNGSARPRPRTMNRGLAAPAQQFQAMTENQRRFVFRLLAPEGLVGEAAHRHLLEHFQVTSLTDVSKESASAFIDELQSRPRGNGSRDPGASVQR